MMADKKSDPNRRSTSIIDPLQQRRSTIIGGTGKDGSPGKDAPSKPQRRLTWGTTTDARPPPRRWRCLKATQSKLAPGNALGIKLGRRIESGETLVEIATETKPTFMNIVSQVS